MGELMQVMDVYDIKEEVRLDDDEDDVCDAFYDCCFYVTGLRSMFRPARAKGRKGKVYTPGIGISGSDSDSDVMHEFYSMRR